MTAPQISPRSAIDAARSHLSDARASNPTDRAAFAHRLEAAIVSTRSAWQYILTARDQSQDRKFRQWVGREATSAGRDPLLRYFKDARDLIIHERRLGSVQRRVALGLAQASIRLWTHVRLRVIRGQPWYRRSISILWQDLVLRVREPLAWQRFRFAGWLDQQLEGLRRLRIVRRPARPIPPSVLEFYLGDPDPEGLDRPALLLVDAYISRLEAIVSRAEKGFPHIIQ